MKPQRTYRLDRLYHKFLKPQGIELEALPRLVTLLFEAEFIDLFRHPDDDREERYAETEKLTGREHRDELFKLIQGLKA